MAALAIGAPITVASCSARWPGSVAGELHGIIDASGDAVTKIPQQRWDVSSSLDHLSEAQNDSVRHGGFLGGAERFDNVCFAVSSAEASVMDPQQRLLLEAGYASFAGAYLRRAGLMHSSLGVYLGIMNLDGHQLTDVGSKSAFAATCRSSSIAAGRLSFTLGLNGVCQSVDTACSSALVAMRTASAGMVLGDHVGALSASVSLILSPVASVYYAQATMLSVDGRCKTLDTRANGYVRSEGVGALVLRRGGEEGVLLDGSAVRQDGRSASLTAPNGSAQRVLLLATLGSAAIAPSEVACVEAHGTGTALGDPTEAGALSAVHGARSASLTTCAAKASVGHAEAASGQVGLLRVWRLLVEAAANYAAANACLDALATCRFVAGRASVSVQWGAWAEVGMAARGVASERMAAMQASSGFSRIGLAHGLAVMGISMRCSTSSVLGVVPVAWSRALGGGAAVPAFLSAFTPRSKGAQVVGRVSVAGGCIISLEAVLEMVKRTAGGAPDADAPLMDAGVDSLGAVELRNTLLNAAGGRSLPSTIVFDHPTARQLTSVLQPARAASAVAVSAPHGPLLMGVGGISIGGLSALLPAGASSSMAASRMVVCGCDAVTEIPASRWDMHAQLAKSELVHVQAGANQCGHRLFWKRCTDCAYRLRGGGDCVAMPSNLQVTFDRWHLGRSALGRSAHQHRPIALGQSLGPWTISPPFLLPAVAN